MEVAIIGGTGFVGSYLVDTLVAAGLRPRVMVRPGSEARLVRSESCTVVNGDLGDVKSIIELLKGADAVIYNVGILREFPGRGITFKALQEIAPKRVIDAAIEGGVQRFLLMSANGVIPEGTPYQRSKYAADEYLMRSSLEWSIFRPSVIFGDPRGRMEFSSQLCQEIVRSPLPAPMFFQGIDPRSAGQFKLSPVHVTDVAKAFLYQLNASSETNRIFHLGGEDVLSWRKIIKTIATSIDKAKLMMPVPVMSIQLAALLLDRFEDFPVTRDQLTMLLQGNICSPADLKSMEITPRRFDPNELGYLNT
ncbi:MAG: NAD(P)H-binding protein [Gammaproteobacteria bacterium]|nr:NAD(P)H-binding protein [Gammaproteobacteria bacterium]